jgi:tRNA threonylcarbamoyladenosine biosynthesis protein TsaB
MKILALDTSTFVASVALVDTDGTRVLVDKDAQVSTHSEQLLPLVSAALADAGLAMRDVDAIACGSGPGSFTGLRIGLATAKGLCFALGKPLVMASSLMALAHEAGDGPEVVLGMLDARRGEVYAGLYRPDEGHLIRLADEVVIAPDRLRAWVASVEPHESILVVGDGVAAYPDAAAACGRIVPGARGTPRAAHLARLAAERLAAGPVDELHTGTPTYVRPSEVERV